jgi:peptidoglycan/xylan/chitin deacetylase (PgdA/CDA1 family)
VHKRRPGRLLVLVATIAAACGPAHAATTERSPDPTVPDAVVPDTAAQLRSAEPSIVAVAHSGPFVEPVDELVTAAVSDATELLTRPAELALDPYAARCLICPRVQPDPANPVVRRSATATAKPISSVATTDPVVFLTIDDGEFWDEGAAALLEVARLPVTLFLTENYIADKVPAMHRLVDAGAWVELHTASHPNLLRTKNTDAEICGPSDHYLAEFGRRSTLFRPPYGNYNATTQSIATSCGAQALVLWRASTNNGALATQGGDVRAGDIVLMHFRPDLGDNLVEVFRILNERGLRVGRLECYVGGDPHCGQPWR